MSVQNARITQNILVLNPGSSTLKFGLYRLPEEAEATGGQQEAPPARGIVDRIGSERAELRLDLPGQPQIVAPAGVETLRQAVAHVLSTLSERLPTLLPDAASIDAVGCRVVHGGARFTGPARVTPEVLAAIRGLSDLAPLHNPMDAGVIEAAISLLPQAPVVAVFDTAFHYTLPEVAATYALPLDLRVQFSLRRYGFHGISHRYVSQRLLECLGRNVPDPEEAAAGTRLITCHLGNGASLCAVRDGRSVDTSMGLTPLEGLVMGSRSGDVDPGLLLYLLRDTGMSAEGLDDLLNYNSGLRGLSGRSGDVRDLEQVASQGDARAELALEVFAYRACKYLGAYAAALEGLDAVAFAGGIGEHSASMRQRICRRLGFMGLHLDPDRNAQADGSQPACISRAEATVKVWVIPTDEEWQIAHETYALLHA